MRLLHCVPREHVMRQGVGLKESLGSDRHPERHRGEDRDPHPKRQEVARRAMHRQRGERRGGVRGGQLGHRRQLCRIPQTPQILGSRARFLAGFLRQISAKATNVLQEFLAQDVAHERGGEEAIEE